MILKREFARAWTALKLEEHRNRNLPELEDANSPEAYNKMADEAAQSLMNFLDKQDIVTVNLILNRPYVSIWGPISLKQSEIFLKLENITIQDLCIHIFTIGLNWPEWTMNHTPA